jgi:hypothetical protein
MDTNEKPILGGAAGASSAAITATVETATDAAVVPAVDSLSRAAVQAHLYQFHLGILHKPEHFSTFLHENSEHITQIEFEDILYKHVAGWPSDKTGVILSEFSNRFLVDDLTHLNILREICIKGKADLVQPSMDRISQFNERYAFHLYFTLIVALERVQEGRIKTRQYADIVSRLNPTVQMKIKLRNYIDDSFLPRALLAENNDFFTPNNSQLSAELEWNKEDEKLYNLSLQRPDYINELLGDLEISLNEVTPPTQGAIDLVFTGIPVFEDHNDPTQEEKMDTFFNFICEKSIPISSWAVERVRRNLNDLVNFGKPHLDWGQGNTIRCQAFLENFNQRGFNVIYPSDYLLK